MCNLVSTNIVIIVVRITVITAALTGLMPLYIAGNKYSKTSINVITRPITAFRPFFPPTIHNNRKNKPIKAIYKRFSVKTVNGCNCHFS